MKYLCLAYESESALNDLSVSEWQALRSETLDYVNALREEGRLLETHPLGSATKACTVQIRNGRRAVTDGPVVETKEQIGGYFLIEAGSMEEAVEIAANWPSARIGCIEVRPVDEELGPERRYT
jgi:hypothetical protein